MSEDRVYFQLRTFCVAARLSTAAGDGIRTPISPGAFSTLFELPGRTGLAAPTRIRTAGQQAVDRTLSETTAPSETRERSRGA
jgi:hypothetical protein